MGNVQSTVPYEAQLNKINVPLACSVNGAAYPAGIANLTFSTTAPLYGGAGQQIYFSDLAGSFNIQPVPADGQSTFPYWQFEIFINTSISNASPLEGVPILQTFGQNSTDGSFVFPGPHSNGALPPLGPFTLGDTGQIAELTLDVISARLDFVTRAGSVRVSNYWLCNPASPPYVISSVPIATVDNPVAAPSLGNSANLPDLDVGTKYTQASFPLDCNGLQGGPYLAPNFTIGGITPASVPSGFNFSIDQLETFLTIPGNLAAVLDGFYGSDPPYGPTYSLGVQLGKGFTVDDIGPALQADVANGSPSSLDIGRNFTTTYPNTANPLGSVRFVPEGDASDQTFPLPQIGSVDAGNFTAGSTGTVFSVTNFTSTFTIGGRANNGLLTGYESFGCVPRTPLDLFSVPIS